MGRFVKMLLAWDVFCQRKILRGTFYERTLVIVGFSILKK